MYWGIIMKNKTILYSSIFSICILSLMILGLSFIKTVNFKDTNPDLLKKDTEYSPSQGGNAKNTIVEFVDFKCPYCKKFQKKMYPSLKKKYIDTNRADYRVVNASILGKDSIRASRASHALYIYYPKKYWDFYDKLFELQPNNENEWISYSLIDRELEKLDIPKNKLQKIKKDYKTKNSKSWKLAKKDKKLYKKYNVEYVPSIYVNGRFIEKSNSLKSFNDNIYK